MANPFLNAITALALFALAIQYTCALQVEFYSKPNYVGYVDGVKKRPGDDKDCYTLANDYTWVGSVKTDECLVLYSKPNCQRQNSYDCIFRALCSEYSVRVDKDTPQFSTEDILVPWQDSRHVHSFHVCSQARGGGPGLDVDYFHGHFYNGKSLQQWRHVCTCQNVPENIRGGKEWAVSILNYGNDMDIFSDENCQGQREHLPAGDNAATMHAVLQNPKFNVASFRPSYLPDCINFRAQISQFYFKNGTSVQPIMQKVWLGTRGHIVNDKAADTTRYFPLSETVTQKVDFGIATGYTKMNTVGVSSRATFSGELGVPLVTEPEISAGISARYQYSRGSSVSNTTTISVSTRTPVQNFQMITVPACHSCTLNAFVSQAFNFPVSYVSHAHVVGYAGNARLSAAEIKTRLPPGVFYVKDADEFNVIAVTQGTMYAQFGLKTFIETDCRKIPNCPPNSLSVKTPNNRMGSESTEQNSKEIGTPMGRKESNWNGLFESSLPF